MSGVPSIGGVGGRFDAPPPITGLFDPLANHLIPSRDDHPAEVERLACELVGLTLLIAAMDHAGNGFAFGWLEAWLVCYFSYGYVKSL